MAFTPIRTYTVTAGASASSAQALALPAGFDRLAYRIQVRITALTNPVIVCFGGGTVAASATVTGNALPDGNFVVPVGTVEVFDLDPTHTHFSAIRAGAGDGVIHITLGQGLDL